MKNLKAVMDKHFSTIKVDLALAKRIGNFVDSFRTRNDDHINFFGSNSFGVYKVIFSAVDRLDWLTDVLDLEEIDVRNDIVALPSINGDWKKYTDVVNMSCVYLIYRFYNANMNSKDKHEAMINVAMVLNIKALTSFMNQSFQYLTTEAISQKVYDKLSYKFSFKKYGNWYNLLRARSEDLISAQSIHLNVIKKFEPDAKILYVLSDVITRIKSIIINLYDTMMEVKDEETKNLKSSMMVEMEDGITVRDVSGQYENYKNYIENVLHERTAFVKTDIAEVIVGLMQGNLPPPMLSDAIIKFYEQYNKKNKQCTELLELILLHAFDKIQHDKEIQKKSTNIAEFLVYMKALYIAPRAKGDIEKMRNIGEKFVKKNVKASNSTVIASTRTGLILYILARTFLKDRY